jgi:hypothetical protein
MRSKKATEHRTIGLVLARPLKVIPREKGDGSELDQKRLETIILEQVQKNAHPSQLHLLVQSIMQSLKAFAAAKTEHENKV